MSIGERAERRQTPKGVDRTRHQRLSIETPQNIRGNEQKTFVSTLRVLHLIRGATLLMKSLYLRRRDRDVPYLGATLFLPEFYYNTSPFCIALSATRIQKYGVLQRILRAKHFVFGCIWNTLKYKNRTKVPYEPRIGAF